MTTALQVVPEGGHEVAQYQAPNPTALINSATEQANALADIIEKRKLYATVNGRRHVTVEGWQTLGALNNLQAFTERVETGTDDKGNYWAAALVSARRMNDGADIARAEGYCSTKEARWRGRDEYAVGSMAQTRATSKVFRQALAWVMVLAGYDSTPAEEMPPPENRSRARTKAQEPAGGPPPPEQPFGTSTDQARMWLATELAGIGVKVRGREGLAAELGVDAVPDSATLGDILSTIKARHAFGKPEAVEGEVIDAD